MSKSILVNSLKFPINGIQYQLMVFSIVSFLKLFIYKLQYWIMSDSLESLTLS